jgi:general secretion pathway protein E
MTPATEARPLLPFVYARAHNIVLLSDGASLVRCLRSTSAQALLEARRVADGPIAVEHLSAEEFEKLLLLSYQRDSAKPGA